ncbi:hypothetical protein FHR22_003838 [Sphingopyxis panaciterrae]|uniref:hypothetical protein n=1 Tax=Sphingopyxis panaciterrae TaxID=363841 RepID=UPI001421B996|nr:hypothetical protein [Sphingopyxis panaciterrae]NIJ39104.1 hypothetical protein [Sphingopyxis panaciterrae]
MAPAPSASWNRFAPAPRPLAAALLALLAALMLIGVIGGGDGARVAGAGAGSMRAESGLIGDHALYANVLHRVEAGESYYTAVAAEHRANDYPLKPFMTVRLPTLMMIVATIGVPAAMALGLLAGVVAVSTWRQRIRSEPGLPRYASLAALFIAVNLSQLTERAWVLMHEAVTGALIALALALYRPARPWAPMAVAGVAVAIRETALPVAMLFGLFALIDRDWRAAAGWAALGLAFLAVLAAHIAALAAVTVPTDLASPGWSGLGGWATYVAFVHETSILRFTPMWTAALLVPLALLGWASWRSRLGLAGLGVQLIYALLLMLFARPDNFYWGMLIAPTLFIGLAFAPAAVTALIRALGPGRLHPAAMPN